MVAMATSMDPAGGPAPSMKRLPSKRAQASKVRRVSWKVRVVTPDGNSEIVQWSKQEFMRRSGLPARDLRPNGPLLSAAATILGREGCIIVSLEHIKAVIAAEETFVLEPMQPEVLRFLSILQRRLAEPPDGAQPDRKAHPGALDLHSSSNLSLANLAQPPSAEQEAVRDRPSPVLGFMPWRSHPEGLELASLSASEASIIRSTGAERDKNPGPALTPLGGSAQELSLVERAQGGGGGIDRGAAEEALPFEFRVLEAILEVSIGRLEVEWKKLEVVAIPALDQLTRRVTTSGLILVREIKVKMTQLTSRVQKVREELEQLLDNDQDMADMYLTRRLAWLRMPDSPPGSASHSLRGSVQFKGESVASAGVKGSYAFGGLGTNTLSAISTSPGGKDVQELEMLLEAYFMQIEGVLSDLRKLHEYVDNTEDYVNIDLDNHRNLLQGLNVILTAGGTILGVVLVFLGLYSMNVANPLYDVEGIFTEVMFTVFGLATGLFAGFVVYAWKTQMVTF